MNKFTETFYQEGVGYDSIREQCETLGVNTQPLIEEGKGATMVMNNGNEIHKAGEWYVYKDGKYSFMSHQEFLRQIENDNVLFEDYTEPGKYTVIGIVPFDTNAVKDGMTRVCFFSLTEEKLWTTLENLEGTITGSVPFGWCTDFDGFGKTNKLKTYAEENEIDFETSFPGAYVAHTFKAFDTEGITDTTQWYLPAIGELNLMYQNAALLSKELVDFDLGGLPVTKIMTVSEVDDEGSLCYYYLRYGNTSDFDLAIDIDEYSVNGFILPFAIVGNVSTSEATDTREKTNHEISHTPDSTVSDSNNPDNKEGKETPEPWEPVKPGKAKNG